MEIATFVEKAARRGIRFEIEGIDLAILTDTLLTPSQIRTIEAREPELIAWIKAQESLIAPQDSIPKCEFIFSRVLEEEVALARDNANLELDEYGLYKGRVVYRDSEMRRLMAQSPSPEHLRSVHAVKKEFGGEIEGEGIR